MKDREFKFVQEMFDTIAPRYDFLNRLLSLRRDVYWRRALVESLELASEETVLDAACGTADVALEVVRSSPGPVRVVGFDFAPEMLRLAAAKLTTEPISLVAADAFDLPFNNAGFSAVTMAFGIRNIQNKAAILRHFLQQLKPGGRVAICELATPTRGPARSAYLFYFNTLLPLIGRFFSKHNFAYRYLPESVANFPTSPEFAALMRRSGFINVRYRELTLGIAVLFVGDKPHDTT
jgi:demethylmenaquinone methyltransferase/2-methoxy-6-polyprenyl-1,4-benzoquinol methylase